MKQSHPAIRQPAVAGRFYPADPRKCAQECEQYTAGLPGAGVELPGRLFGGIVPHAGWVCSGRIAGMVWRALSQRTTARTIFLTGSVHTVDLNAPALDQADAWNTPVGDVAVDVELREAIAGLDEFQTRHEAHRYEHALEVQLPMLRQAFGPDVKIVACMIPPHDRALVWGKRLGELLRGWPRPVLVVASSDLTHYGPNYGFVPHGIGASGIAWAYEVNDRRLLDEVQRMRADAVVKEAREHLNACGGGAIAAVMAAAQIIGAQKGYLLEHTNSTRELAPLGYADDANSVGYAGVVFG